MFRKMALAAAISIIAAGCGGTATTDASAAEEEGIESFEDLEFESPIAEFLGQDASFDFNSDEAQAEFTAQATEAEEQIAACMAAEGFEYTPVDQGQYNFFDGEGEELPYFSEAWVAKYGFGITTQWFGQSEVGTDLVGYDDAAFSEAEDSFVDPNEAYVEGLPEAEQIAYYEALYGNEPELPEDATEEDYDAAYENWEPDGCANEAWSDFDGGFSGEGFYNEFGDELDALYERIEADPRVDAHNQEVSACVAEQGLEYTGMNDLYMRWEDELSSMGGGDPFAESEVDFENMSEEELDAYFADFSFELSDEDKVALGEIQAEEMALATAVIECGGGPLNDEIVLGQVRVEYEQDFLDANQDRLSGFEGGAGDS